MLNLFGKLTFLLASTFTIFGLKTVIIILDPPLLSGFIRYPSTSRKLVIFNLLISNTFTGLKLTVPVKLAFVFIVIFSEFIFFESNVFELILLVVNKFVTLTLLLNIYSSP